MKITVLGSGSKGNSTLIETTSCNILIDAGLTLKNIEKRLGTNLPKINIIIITHTHKDHIGGLKSFIKKYKPLIITKSEELKNLYPGENIINDSTYEQGNISITLFDLSHDSPCTGISLKDKEKELIYITDTGYINQKILKKIKNKNIYIMESNHDTEMLRHGSYPFYLQQRIMSDKGHLSNQDAAKYLKNIIGDNTEYIVLAHLSEENNTESLAQEETKKIITTQKLYIAKQNEKLEAIEV